ncbi:MAG: HAD family hydrolase, partial [Eubacteriales bacterium]|nr:HAD family hydrolase [Eubacteriales bacterium]
TIHEVIEQYLDYDQPLAEYMQYCGIPDAQMWPAILEDLGEKRKIRDLRKWYEEILRRFPAKDGGTGDLGLTPGTENETENVTRDGGEDGTEDVTENPVENRTEDIREYRSRICEILERLHWADYDTYIEKHGVQAFPGMRDLLCSLQEEGIKIAVATGSLRRIVEDNLDLLRIRPFVDAVATSEDCENGKPSPDVFLTAAKLLETDPGDCLVVEDAENGLIAAERAGMCRAAFTGSRIPSKTADPPAFFSDYREVSPGVLHEWYRRQSEAENHS